MRNPISHAAQYLSRYVAARLDQAIEKGVYATSRRKNLQYDITLRFTIRNGSFAHRISVQESDVSPIPSGRIMDGKVILPEVDPEFDGRLFAEEELQNASDYPELPRLASVI